MKLRQHTALAFLVAAAASLNVAHWILEVLVAPDPGTWLYWATTTTENLQSEVWQIVLTAAVASGVLLRLRWDRWGEMHHEQQRLDEKLDRIQATLDQLTCDDDDRGI